MKNTILILVSCLMIWGCSAQNPNVTTEASIEETEDRFHLPVEIETEDGIVELSNVFIQQLKTEHGYSGYIVLEFDLSALDEDDQYWFEKDYSISVYDSSYMSSDKNIMELNEFGERKSAIQGSGKKYFFEMISERKTSLNDAGIFIDVEIRNRLSKENTIEIRGTASDFDIVDKLPSDIEKVYLELVWDDNN